MGRTTLEKLIGILNCKCIWFQSRFEDLHMWELDFHIDWFEGSIFE